MYLSLRNPVRIDNSTKIIIKNNEIYEFQHALYRVTVGMWTLRHFISYNSVKQEVMDDRLSDSKRIA